MRFVAAALVLFVSLSASAQQERFAGVTLASGYATGFEAGAVHTEARVQIAFSERVSLEPMASWTRGFAYDYNAGGVCYDFCSLIQGTRRVDGASALALGSALTYRLTEALPLGLDAAHAGVFAQVVTPIWTSRGQRVGAEVGTEVRLGRSVSVGADVQAAYFTASDAGLNRVSVTPLLRFSVGR